MQVKDILAGKSRDIYTIHADATVFDAISKMSGLNVGSLLVTDGPSLIGIISDRDYRDKVILMGRTSRETRVSEIMSTNVITVGPNDSIEACMQIMTTKKIRHLPVLEDYHIEGVVSIGDMVKAIIDRQKAEINDLKKYIKGSYP
jgi:CBS domain-containing protein